MPNDESPARLELIDEIAAFVDPHADMLDADEADDIRAYLREMIIDQPLTSLVDLPADDREMLTEACLRLSLCPVHLIDYAICFDDDAPDCRVVRIIHPTHDS